MDQLTRLQLPHRLRGQSGHYGRLFKNQAGSLNQRKCNCIKGSQYFIKYDSYSKINLFYIHIGILGRSADNIYIYIDVVITYYSKEDTRPPRPHGLRGQSGNYGGSSKSGAKFELKKTQLYKRIPIFS